MTEVFIACSCGKFIDFDVSAVSYGKDTTREQRLVRRHNFTKNGWRQRAKVQCECGESYQILFQEKTNDRAS